MFDASPRPELLLLLAAVKAEPDDDTPKLVLADWLQEQDHETDRTRGEFLRGVVQFNRMPDDDPERSTTETKLKIMWNVNRPRWCSALVDAGFLCTWLSNREVACGLVYPLIDGTKLVTKKAQALAGSEAYAWVSGLYFARLSSLQIIKFSQLPLLETLIGLTFQGCNTSHIAIAKLVRRSHT